MSNTKRAKTTNVPTDATPKTSPDAEVAPIATEATEATAETEATGQTVAVEFHGHIYPLDADTLDDLLLLDDLAAIDAGQVHRSAPAMRRILGRQFDLFCANETNGAGRVPSETVGEFLQLALGKLAASQPS